MSLAFGKYCIYTPKIPLFFAGIIIILGILAATFISKESSPYIEYGVVTIVTPYSGVGAEDVDSTVTQKIENTVKSVSGIDTMESSSLDGISKIVLTLKTGEKVSDVVSDLRSAVDEAKPDLPTDLDADPRIAELDSSGERTFLKIALLDQKKKFSPAELSLLAEDLEKKIEKISGVDGVTIENQVETEVKIFLNKNKLESYNLSYSQILGAIKSSEKNTPLGTLSLDKKDYTLRFQGESETIEGLGEIIIGRLGTGVSANAIHLKDIAVIKEEAIKNAPITHFYDAEFPEENFQKGTSVVLKVSRTGGGDVFGTEKKVLAEVENFLEKPGYSDLHSSFFRQSTIQMKKDYWNLLSSFISSIAIVMLSIFFFIGVREGLVASTVIPLSFLGTIVVIFFMGGTMNIMTNFGMILALGILVDTAIVMVEGTEFYIKKGLSPQDAAFESFKEFRAPLFAGMLTTLIVFIPLFFLPGIVGKFLSFIPITVTIVLILALLISLFIIPALSGVMLKNIPEKKTGTRSKIKKILKKTIEKYVELLKKILINPILKYGVFLGTVGVFVATFLIPTQFEMFPTKDSDGIQITFQLPEGTDESVVSEKVRPLEDFIANLPETKTLDVSLQDNVAHLSAELFPFGERAKRGDRTSLELETLLQKEFSQFGKGEGEAFQVQREKKGPPSKFPVGFRVKIEDISQIEQSKEVTRALTKIVENTSGTQGVTNSIREMPGEFRFVLDREQAFLRGINPADIPFSIRGAVYGSVATTFTKGGTDLDIRLQVDPKSLQSIEDILSVEIQNGVHLSDVVKVEETQTLAEVARNEGDLTFTVSSFLTKDGNAKVVTELVKKKIDEGVLNLPDGITIEDASENAENGELIQTLGTAFVMALLFMFLILVIQFEAFAPPLLILQTVVFAQIGVAIGLYLTDTPKSMSYMLGLISLSGIVVNDAIILVDKIRKNIFSGEFVDKLSAVLDAGKTRFIPVVLTTITTSAGIVPLIFIDSFWAGLAYTIIFGLSVSSVLTLFLIPIGYLLFEKTPENSPSLKN